MARPRTFDEDKVMEAIKNVFWNYGYEGTSYADLIDASGLHKGSLYAAFGDKRALYIEALRHYDEQEIAQAVDLLTKGQGARIESLFNAVIDAVKIYKDLRGCLLCNAAIDQAKHNKDVEKSVSLGIQRMLNALIQALQDQHKHISNVEQSASHMCSVYFLSLIHI